MLTAEGRAAPLATVQVYVYVVSSPDPTLEEEKGLVGPTLRNFHAPMRS